MGINGHLKHNRKIFGSGLKCHFQMICKDEKNENDVQVPARSNLFYEWTVMLLARTYRWLLTNRKPLIPALSKGNFCA